jgi:uncharacterized protein YggE
MNRKYMALALAAALTLPAAAARADNEPSPRIVVTGEGEASVAPDLALLSLSVMREAKTAREALDANNDAMAQVIAAMRLRVSPTATCRPQASRSSRATTTPTSPTARRMPNSSPTR